MNEEYIIFKGKKIPLPKDKKEVPAILEKYFSNHTFPGEVVIKFAEHLHVTPKNFKILEKKLLGIAGDKVLENHPLTGTYWKTKFAIGLVKNGKQYGEKNIEVSPCKEYTID